MDYSRDPHQLSQVDILVRRHETQEAMGEDLPFDEMGEDLPFEEEMGEEPSLEVVMGEAGPPLEEVMGEAGPLLEEGYGRRQEEETHVECLSWASVHSHSLLVYEDLSVV